MEDSVHATPLLVEDHSSQIPALQLLQNLGWEYLTAAQALELRGGRLSNVLLDGIIEQQLPKMNRVRYKGEDHPFSESNIYNAIQALKSELFDGLIRTNEKIYDLLCLGKAMQQSIRGDLKSFTLDYIDWERPERNVYHVTEEFEVERTGRKEKYVPDLVLFVNGIPLAVIECKKTELGPGRDPVEQAISQHVRNQKEEGIPGLFVFSQLLLAVSKNGAKYATTGTPKKFWALWRELDAGDEPIREAVNRPLSPDRKQQLFSGRFAYVREHFDAVEAEGGREITEQDKLIWSLCRPERLLRLSYRYIVFDAGVKKIARYQQYFCVENTLRRIRKLEGSSRRGGVVWHTQGSGKSLTMVMLAKAIALEDQIDDHKVVLVTDRTDLDEQIERTFKHCGLEPKRANTGSELTTLLRGRKRRVITTVINKFEAADKQGVQIRDPNIFVLVDEGHRTQFGSRHATMRGALPNACFIGFTGTPVLKSDKSTVDRFGGLIQPIYSIRRAVDDKAVVPLLYEGRHVVENVHSKELDEWFDWYTDKLSDAEKADLKKKYARAEMLLRAEPVVKAIARDVSEHFRDGFQGTRFKGQLVAPRKETALLYKHFLDEFGIVRSAVLISAPDDREGEEEIGKENTDVVVRFWKAAMDRYGSGKEYERQVINAFKHGDPNDDEDAPEIIIVVSKLLTGFDAPRNAVLYLARTLREHTLLQAIARVNRLDEGKEFGYILDYRGVLDELNAALDLYAEFPGVVEQRDLTETVTKVEDVIGQLPQKHSAVWDIFKTITTKRDQEAYELLLADEALRVRFYDKFSEFARLLDVARSSASYRHELLEQKRSRYEEDCKFFASLRTAVRRRYAEIVDFSEYEPKIRKLLDDYLGVQGVEHITGVINLFDERAKKEALAEIKGRAAKADMIAHNTKRLLEEKWQKEDPAFFKQFSQLLRETIDRFHDERRADRLTAQEYLKEAERLENAVVTRTGDTVPEIIRDNDVAKAYYGSVRDVLGDRNGASPEEDLSEVAALIGLKVDEIVDELKIVNWGANPDVQNRMRQAIEDYLFEVNQGSNLGLTFDEIDTILDDCLQIAKERRP